MKRMTTDELADRMKIAEKLVPQGFAIRHVRTGQEYTVRGHAMRVGDLELLVQYSPLAGSVVVFSRPVSEIQAKFVRWDGEQWCGA